MLRRQLLAGAAAAATLSTSGLPRPAIAQTAARTLRFIPEGNLQNPDPIWATTTVARNFGYMVWDTLFGVNEAMAPTPQMVEAYEVGDAGLTWRMRLRDGLTFHDNTPVRSADCIASVKRWMKRDGFGQRLEAALNEIRAIDDRAFEFKLKKPFPLLALALGKPTANVCFIMPERMATTDAYKQIDEYTGSGPYRFLREQWVPGALATFARNEAYVPRQEAPSFVAGGKVANFDRIEWKVMPDPATAAGAMQNGEADWWQTPSPDLLALLRKARGVNVDLLDKFGTMAVMRFNMLHPPFDNVKLRRAILPAIVQDDFMAAAIGSETELFATGVGVFTPGSPLANTAGLDVLTGPRDLNKAKRLVAESGYKGERVVFLAPTDYPVLFAYCQVGADLLRKVGLNVDFQASDWGTMINRRNNKGTVDNGGWSAFCTSWEGLNLADPGAHAPIGGQGEKGWFGWYSSQRMEDLRSAWFDAPDLATQKKVAEQIQLLTWEEVPFYPLGQAFQPLARRSNIEGIVKAPFPLFWNVKKTA
ncbi:ABC transporter substrate-binding protein [Limobrevibacterium gyesilva]|uniref:ABC transporter substrate-binding protein n=1 Tax=Limobrevibacterium gyesilva TaxID=2991712 RepID=A0AA42CIC9_9PROT|nr:ABC transporter substrate-binding protein [Limobrevibacterium gyesilva]MCW3475802.1 ABC transporter substrate-binding protein [Limobrevibacterium gyesilva]